MSRRRRTTLLDDATFERRIGELLSNAQPSPPAHTKGPKRRRPRTLDEAIRDAVVEALEYHRRGKRWNISEAAITLATHRSRVRRLVKRYGLRPGATHGVAR